MGYLDSVAAIIEHRLRECLPRDLAKVALGYADDEVRAVLRIDAHCRASEGAGGLRSVATLHPGLDPYRGPLPALAPGTRSHARLDPVYVAADGPALVYIELCRRFPGIEGLDLQNILVAGGAISSILTGHQAAGQDLDLFIYGLDPGAATAKVGEIFAHLVLVEGPLAQTLQPHVLKLKGRHEYQIITRLYRSPGECLHGFDLGPSAAGLYCTAEDELRCDVTELGAFALTRGAIIADHTRCSLSYAYRMEKYRSRGFAIVFPDLDIDALASNGHPRKSGEGLVKPGYLERCLRGRKSARTDGFTGHIRGFGSCHSSYDDHDRGSFRSRRVVKDLIRGNPPTTSAYGDSLTGYDIDMRDISVVYSELRSELRGGWQDHASQAESLRRRFKNYVSLLDRAQADTLAYKVGGDATPARVLRLLDLQEQETVRLAHIYVAGPRLRWITGNPGGQGELLSGAIHPLRMSLESFYGRRLLRRPPCVLSAETGSGGGGLLDEILATSDVDRKESDDADDNYVSE